MRPLFIIVTIAMLLIMRLEWRKMKSKPRRDRTIFICLSIGVWLMFLLDLPHTPGPTSLLNFVFRPFAAWTQP